MNLKVTTGEVIKLIVILTSAVGVLAYYIYNLEKNIPLKEMSEFREDFESFKKKYELDKSLYKVDIKDFKDEQAVERKILIKRIESMGDNHTKLLEKIYQQGAVSAKDISDIRVAQAQSDSNYKILASKLDTVLSRVDSNERRDLEQDKQLLVLKENIAILNKAMSRIAKEKKFSFLEFKYGYDK